MAVDFHSHILPGIDDGSTCVEESIAMLRMEAEQGIRHVVATPHFYAQHDTPERFLNRRREAELRLREEMERHEGLPEVSIGAEVYFFYGISDSDALEQLTIAGKRCILLEMPHPPWSERMYQELAAIRAKRGVIPVLAHIDRYISPFHTHGIPQRLEQMDVLVQANAGFFLRKLSARMGLGMLERNQIHLLGSDCHNLTGRSPNLGAALQVIGHRLGGAVIDGINRVAHELLGRDRGAEL